MVMRIAEFWADFGVPPLNIGCPSQHYALPGQAHITAMKTAGFDSMMFTEINYITQMCDLDYCIANPSNNPLKTAFDLIKAAGMRRLIKMNPGRYGANPSDTGANVSVFLKTPLYYNKFLKHIEYLVQYDVVDGIELEEPAFGLAQRDLTFAFFQQCRQRIPAPKLFGFNYPSNSEPNISINGFDSVMVNLVNTNKIFDYMSTQPQGPFTAANQLSAYNSWKSRLNSEIVCGAYVWDHSGTNPLFIDNIKQAVTNGWSLKAWPSRNLTAIQLNELRTIFAPPVQTGTVTVDTTPQGAAVMFDGGHYGVTPRGASNPILNILPGTYTLELTLPGFETMIDQNVQVFAGQNTDKKYNLVPVCVPDWQCEIVNGMKTGFEVDGCGGRRENSACIPMGTLSISSIPSAGAKIFLDNIDTKSVTPAVLQVSPGIPHTIRLVLPGYKEFIESNITVSADQTITKIYSLSGKGAAGTVITIGTSLVVATALYGIGKLLKR